jgi:hypothetical protein
MRRARHDLNLCHTAVIVRRWVQFGWVLSLATYVMPILKTQFPQL